MSKIGAFFKSLGSKAKSWIAGKAKSEVKSAGKGIWDTIKSGVSPNDNSVSVNSIVDSASKALKTVKSEMPVIKPEKSDIPKGEVPVNLRHPEQSGPQQIISYKQVPSVTLKSEDKDAIEEFKRHNKEVERLMNLDIQLDEKLGRDKYGKDIIADEQAEAYRKAMKDLAEGQEKRELEDRKAQEKARAKAEADAKAAELDARSRGRLEDSENGNEGEGQGDGSQSGEGGDESNGILSKIGSFILSPISRMFKPIARGIKSIGAKITKPIIKSIKSLGSKIASVVKPVVSKAASAVKKVLSPVVSAVKKPLTKVADAVKSKIIAPVKKVATKVGTKIASSRAWKATKFLAKPKALQKLGKKMLSKIMPAVPKIAAKLGMTLAKQGAKSALRQVPIVGIALGVGEAIGDIVKGDYVGAGLAALAGIAPTLNLIAPGVGTAISLGAIGADIAREVLKQPMEEAMDVFDNADPETIENEPDIDLANSVNVPDEAESGAPQGSNDIEEPKTENQSSSELPSRTTEDSDYDEYDNYSPSANYPETQGFNPIDAILSNSIPKTPATPTKVNMSLSKPQSDRVAEAMGVLMNPNELGLSKEQAAGVVGVLMAESKLNPQAYNKAEKNGTAKDRGIKHLPEEYGAGIAQWTYHSRKKPILDYINKKFGKAYTAIEQATLPEQVAAVSWELKSKRPRILEKLRGAKTVAEATDIALRGYENGSANELASKEFIDKYTWAGGYHGSMYGPSNGRVHFAEAAYRAAGGDLVRTPADTFIEETTGQFVSPMISESHSEPTSIKADLSVAAPESTSVTPIAKEPAVTPPMAIKEMPEIPVVAQAPVAPSIVKEGDYVGPTVNGGTTVNNITYANVNNELNAEVFG